MLILVIKRLIISHSEPFLSGCNEPDSINLQQVPPENGTNYRSRDNLGPVPLNNGTETEIWPLVRPPRDDTSAAMVGLVGAFTGVIPWG